MRVVLFLGMLAIGCAAVQGLVLVQDRFWGKVVSYFACDIPQYLSES